MTIFFKGQILTLSPEPQKAVHQLIGAVVAAYQQSYPEKLK